MARAAGVSLAVAAVMGCRIQDQIKEWRVNPTFSVSPSTGCSPEWQSDVVSTKISGVGKEQAYRVAMSVAGQLGTIDLEDGTGYLRLVAQGMKFNISLESTIADTKVTVKGSWPADKSVPGRNLMNEIHRRIVEQLGPPATVY